MLHSAMWISLVCLGHSGGGSLWLCSMLRVVNGKDRFSTATIIFGGFQCRRRKYIYFLLFLWTTKNTETFSGFFRWAVGKAYVRRFFPLGRRKSLCSVIFPYWAAKTYWVAEDN
jgi:hypothetical protein